MKEYIMVVTFPDGSQDVVGPFASEEEAWENIYEYPEYDYAVYKRV